MRDFAAVGPKTSRARPLGAAPVATRQGLVWVATPRPRRASAIAPVVSADEYWEKKEAYGPAR
jgi:hypothetical protein